MKKLIMLSVVGVLFVTQGWFAVADAKSLGTTDTGPGCGFGKIWWAADPSAKSKGVQILMGTSNGLFGSQTFGISSGTLGCTDNGKWWAEQKTIVFAELNFETLTQEIAQGHGEYLGSLATLMGIPAEQQSVFFALVQQRYESLVEIGDISPAALVNALKEAIAMHPNVGKVAMSH